MKKSPDKIVNRPRATRASPASLTPKLPNPSTLEFKNLQRTKPLHRGLLKKITLAALSELEIENWNLTFYFVGSKRMAEINSAHMHHEGPTDVITFNYSEPATRALQIPSPPRPGTSDAGEAEEGIRSSEGRGGRVSGRERVTGITGEVSISASEHATRNTQHAPIQSPTALFGEIFICVDIAVTQSREFRTTWQSEVVRYIVHALLHLCGYDDLQHVARREMKRHENRLVRQLESTFAFNKISRAP